jgi:hypothetical protein
VQISFKQFEVGFDIARGVHTVIWTLTINSIPPQPEEKGKYFSALFDIPMSDVIS